MKKSLLVCVFTFFIFFSYSQKLFDYGNHSVSETEFLNAFNKNKTNATDNSQALQNYLELYIKFKLKVQAARDMKLDTLPSLVADLQNFRNQIKGNYLTDQDELQKLNDEAFFRSQKDIHAVYYYLHSGKDSLKEKEEINLLVNELKSGKPDAEIIAKLNSLNSDKIQKVNLGYITAFSVPYQFENIIYHLKPESLSAPYHSKNGWYIFKNEGERKAVGKITVAQILFAVPRGGTKIQKEQAKEKADSVYHVLMQGGDFATLAKEFSDDRNTYLNGGKLPEFGTAKYDSIFESQSFSLKKDGEVSQPFETPFGYHIVKRISASPVPKTKDAEAFMYNLKQQVMKDQRSQLAKQKFDQKIIPVVGLKKNSINQSELWKFTSNALQSQKNTTAGKINPETILFTFNDNQKVMAGDWINYARNSQKDFQQNNSQEYQNAFSQFVKISSEANYASRLEDFDPSFKSQIDEFKEGNMLFEIMQRKVWTKASSDTAGLKEYYNEHHQKYLWDASAEAVIFSCSDKEVAKNCIEQLKKGKSIKDIINENPSKIQADSGRFELGQIPVIDRTAFSAGLITLPVINKTDGTAVFAKIFKLYPENQQRNFEDARGLVINDYQNFLEQKWLEQLKKKYPVKVNEKLFQVLLAKN